MNRPPLDHPTFYAGLFLLLQALPPAQSAPGDLDVRFGTHGQTEVPGQMDSAAIIALPDGRILVFGIPEDPTGRADGSIAVARLLANGQPDSQFAPAGHRNLRLGTEPLPIPTDALLLADGRILLAGYFSGNEPIEWANPRSRAAGWLVRLSSDAVIDPTFGADGVARAGEYGIDRIVLLADGAIAAATPGLLQRLDPLGAPVFFPGSEESAVPLKRRYPMSAMTLMHDGSLITSALAIDGWDAWWELLRVSISGGVTERWRASNVSNASFSDVSSFAPDGDGTRLMACGHGYSRTSKSEALLVQRWVSDGSPDPAFAPETGGHVELGVQSAPHPRSFRAPRCRALLPGPAGGHIVVGDWSNSYAYGGGRILLAHLDANGAIDSAFDRTGRGRELELGKAERWSNWYVADAATAPDGAALLIARRTSSSMPDLAFNEPGKQRTWIARVEVLRSEGAGTVGFNDAGVRITERRPSELKVYRSGGATGSISVRYEMLHDTTDGSDVAPTAGTLTWRHGDASVRAIPLAPQGDSALEGEEHFRIRLSEPTGGAALGAPEIEVTMEDDDALRALQFAEPVLLITKPEPFDFTITPLASVRGPLLVRYAVGPALDPNDGTVKGTSNSSSDSVRELRWNAGDTSSRTLKLGTRSGNETYYIALADVAGTLDEGTDWKVARITVALPGRTSTSTPPSNSSPSTGGGPGSSNAGGGGSLSLELLALLTLVLLLRFGSAVSTAGAPVPNGRTRS